MFRCNNKKIDWYLKRGLAEIVSNDPTTIKLNFKPNGLGNHTKGYGLSEMSNKCVNCGSDNKLTKHHVIPISYRRYFPIKIKSHNFHDVLPMCVDCHESYERRADELKSILDKKYDAPIQGEIINNAITKYIKMARTLLKDIKLPKNKRYEIKEKLKEKFEIKRLTIKKIKKISEMKSSTLKRTHGEIVMSKITNIPSFIEMWRKHFIENNECKYLPKKWNIKYK